MAREFSAPLTTEDVAWLEQRYSEEYVARLKQVHGTEDDAENAEALQDLADKAAEEAEKGRLEAQEQQRQALEAQRAAEAQAEVERAQADADALLEPPADGLPGDPEDLLGTDEFDVLGSTEGEVKAWAAEASDEDKATALATEQAREDRDPRKGVVSLLS